MSKTRKNRGVSMVLAAIATSLTVGAVPAEAHRGGLNERQVRQIVKQEVAKNPRRGPRGPAGPRGEPGPAGPAGPPGVDGMPTLFAHVNLAGHVDDGNPASASGITNENVRRVETPAGNGRIDITYCFVGLPPVGGAQVTVDGLGRGDGRGDPIPAPQVVMSDDPDCNPLVKIPSPQFAGVNQATSFFIVLY